MKTGIIVEDLPEACEWLRSALLIAFPCIEIHCAACVEDGIKLLETVQPDIALVDLNLPDGSGVEVIQALNYRCRDAYPVVTTIYNDDKHLFPALKAGAKGYLLKEDTKENIARALKGIVNSEPPLSASIANKLLSFFKEESLNPPASVNTTGSQFSQVCDIHALSAREQEVLTIIAKGYKTAEAAESLNLSYHTVAKHIKNIYAKLNICSRAEATTEAIKMGLLN